MVRKTSIRIDVDKNSLKKIKQLEKKLPSAVMKGISDGTEQLAFSLRTATNIFSYPTGALSRSINVINEDENTFEIRMAEYGEYLNESSRYGHWRSLKPGRKITDWARRAGYGSWVKGIHVLGPGKPYEGWINNALSNSTEQISSSIKDQLGGL